MLRKIKRKFSTKDTRVVMVGLDGAGKSRIVELLRQHSEDTTRTDTIGFNVENMAYKNMTLTLWDVGGKGKVRPLWRHYFQGARGLVFVVDASNREKMQEAKAELDWLLGEEDLKEAALLVLSCTEDGESSGMGTVEVEERLQLAGLTRPCLVREVEGSTKQGVGLSLHDALDWLSEQLMS